MNDDDNLNEIKPLIRGILLALGRRTTEREFRREYFENEEESFNEVLRRLNIGFVEFLKRMPDVCRVMRCGEDVVIERVSTNESSHMDHLTIEKKRKRIRLNGFRPHFNRFVTRPSNVYLNHPHRPPSYIPNTGLKPYRSTRSPVKFKTYSRAPLKTALGPYQNNTNVTKLLPKPMFSQPTKPYPDRHPVLSLDILPPAPHLTKTMFVVKPDTDKNSNKENVDPSETTKPSSDKSNTRSLPLLFQMNSLNIRDDKTVDTAEEINNNCNNYESSSSSVWSTEGKPPKRLVDSSMTSFKYQRFSTFDISDIHKSVQVNSQQDISEVTNDYNGNETVQSSAPDNSQMNTSISSTKSTSLAEFLRRKTEATLGKLKVKALSQARASNEKSKFVTEPMSIPQPRIDEFRGFRTRMFFEVKILSSNSPSQFIFQFNKSELDSMMNEMNIHYTKLKDSEEYKIGKIVVGMTVAVFDDDKWYRAEVLYLNGSEVFVLFVDFTSRKLVKVTNLRYLEKRFASITRKSARGALFGVKPKNGAELWTIDSIMIFMSQIESFKWSVILKLKKNGVYSLSMANENCLKLSDFMIEQGFAEADEKVDNTINAIML